MPIPAPQQVLDFDRVANEVLRNFFLQIGLPAGEYAAAPIRQPQPWEEDAQLAVPHWKSIAADWTVNPEIVNGVLSFALLLDQHCAPHESMRAVLPENLLNINAMGCLLMGRALLRDSKIEEAKAFFLRGVIIDPRSGSLLRELGGILRRQGDDDHAALHLEDALELRETFNPSRPLDPNTPILITRPTPSVDIYCYRNLFYVVQHPPGSIGPSARAIGGELFGVNRNTAYAFARAVLRLPLIKRFAIRMQAAMVAHTIPPTTPSTLAPTVDSRLYSKLRSVVAESRKFLLQKLALSMFARRIDFRTDSLLEAVEAARAIDDSPAANQAGYASVN